MTSNTGATEHHEFYGDGANAAAVAVDLSGNGNCTAGATWIYQAAFSSGDPCTVMVDIEIEASDPAGYVFARYSGTTRQGVRWNGASSFQIVVSNAVVHTLSALTSGRFIIHWSMAADPLNSGSMRSEVRIWDHATSAFLSGISWTHADPSIGATDIIWGAQVTAGTNGTGGTLRGAGYLLHDTSELQVYRDRMTSAAAPTLVGDTAMEVPMPDWSSNFGEQGEPAGPTHYVGAAAVAENHLLLASPLVNIQWNDPDETRYSTMATDAWWMAPPSGDGYMGIPWLWRRPVPRTVNKMRVRAFVHSGRSSGAAENTVYLTAWSCSRNPGIDSETLLASYSDTQSFGPVNDTLSGSPGRWVTFDTIRLARDEDDFTWLLFSVEVTGPSSGTQNVTIISASMEPISEADTDAIGEVGSG